MKLNILWCFRAFCIATLPVLLLLASCGGGGADADAKKQQPPVVVDVMVAAEQEIPASIEVNGTVLSDESVELHPEVSGRIVFLNIPDGKAVGKGTVLARINDADLQAQLEQQKVQLDLANKTEKRLMSLLAVNGVNQAEYDVALSQVNLIEANIKVLNAQIEKTIVRAPFSGKLGLRLVSNGAYVSPQTTIGTLQTDKVKIDFTLPEVYAPLIKPRNKVMVQGNGSDEKYPAVMSAVEPQVNISTRNIKVRAHLESGTLTPGSFVKVYLDREAKGIAVPTQCIIPDAFSSQVIVVEKGKAVFKNVETGIRTADKVQITGGLKPGDSIVISGMLYLRPNAKVKIKKSNPQKGS